MEIIFLIISFLFFIISSILFYNAKKIKIEKDTKQFLYQKQLQNEIKDSEQKAQQQINKINENLQYEKEKVLKQKEAILNELNKMKNSLDAGIQARLREQQKINKINFYKLSIDENDLNDIKKLENLKLSLYKPIILSKLIWTQYFQKQMTELCDRILGKEVKCGIYKITNILTNQCYIGQSTDIAARWKAHCKCGLGIDASATNTLYNNMQKHKVWNFTFELLEQCPKQQLNEKQRFWIDFYSSNIYGLNKTKGNK